MTRKEIIKEARRLLNMKDQTKAKHEVMDRYNKHKPLARGYKIKRTDPWCATFISALAIKTKSTSIIPTEVSAERMIERFKKINRWVEDDRHVPRVGDIIFYDWQDTGKGDNKGWSDHVGIVSAINGNTITVIEGNKSDKVGIRIVKVNGKFIRGYATPKYKSEPKLKNKTNQTIAREVIQGKWGNGSDRVKRLKEAGYIYKDIQNEVNKLLRKG